MNIFLVNIIEKHLTILIFEAFDKSMFFLIIFNAIFSSLILVFSFFSLKLFRSLTLTPLLHMHLLLTVIISKSD